MLRYIIGLDLARPHQNAAATAEVLRSLDQGCENILANVWMVKTNLPVQHIHARIAPHLTSSDKLYICDVGTEFVGVNLNCQVAPHRPPPPPGVEGPAFFMATLLRSILKRRSKLLTAATAENSRSA